MVGPVGVVGGAPSGPNQNQPLGVVTLAPATQAPAAPAPIVDPKQPIGIAPRQAPLDIVAPPPPELETDVQKESSAGDELGRVEPFLDDPFGGNDSPNGSYGPIGPVDGAPGGSQATCVQCGGAISPLTTKGDLFGFSTKDARIPVGPDGQVLTADATQALGLKWAAAASGGGADVACRLTNSAPQTIAALAGTTLTWDTESWDTDSFHSGGAPTRITIPVGKAGKYQIQAAVVLTQVIVNPAGFVLAQINKNGAPLTTIQTSKALGANQTPSVFIGIEDNPVVGDFYEIFVNHNDGGGNPSTIAAQTFFWVRKVDKAG